MCEGCGERKGGCGESMRRGGCVKNMGRMWGEEGRAWGEGDDQTWFRGCLAQLVGE